MADSIGTSTGRSRTVHGLFRDRDSAERFYGSLSSRGYGRDDINLLMSEDTRNKYFAGDKDSADTDLGDKAWEDAGKGAAIGAGIGAGVGTGGVMTQRGKDIRFERGQQLRLRTSGTRR